MFDMFPRVAAAAWLCAAVAVCMIEPATAAAVCKRQKLELPVTIVGTNPVISAQINGQEARFMIDSGAFWSMVSAAAAAEYHLKLSPAPYGLVVGGVGGSASTQLTHVKALTLGGFTLPNREFLVGGTEVQRDSVGVLGQNFLEKWDVEYDLAKGMIRLFQDVGCDHTLLAYWVGPNDPYSAMDIPWTTPLEPHTVGTAFINGVKIRVMFDTGAAYSVLSLKAAARAGVKPETPGVVPAGQSMGIGRRLVDTYVAPFDSFKIGDGEEIKHVKLRIADIDLSSADLLVGADFFLSHRVFVANSQHKLYLTYNGGPVFNLSPHHLQPADSDAAPGQTLTENAAGPAAPGVGEPKDAAAYARRGSALAGRHDYAAAIADLGRAIELEPSNADYVFQRAEAYAQKGDAAATLADLDRAVALRPGHIPAHMARADLRIDQDNFSGAGTDLAAVDSLAAKEADVRITLAMDYGRIEQAPAAIAQWDLWISAHAEDARLAFALSERCTARLLAHQDLSLALKDCNAAVNKGAAGQGFDKRGMVRLRLGDYKKSIADFDDALKALPSDAWALYGRGIAKSRLGLAGAEADFTQASALVPNIAESFKPYGIDR